LVKKRTKRWISATISEEMYNIVRQKALEIYGGNFSKGLEHIIAVYQSVWTDLMLARFRHDIMMLLKMKTSEIAEE